MRYDKTSLLSDQSRAFHNAGKPRDASDIYQEEGADGLRRALDTTPPIATSAAQSHLNSNGTRPWVANGASVAPDIKRAWPSLDNAALYGLAGDIVRAIEPHSESDPASLLLHILALAGNAIGPLPYYEVESDRHRANAFVVLVGNTSKARKGTSAGRIKAITKLADPAWSDERIKSGLSSGEGLINEVRDQVQKWDSKTKAFEVVDPGVSDKRLMIFEPEFACALRVAERHGNTLSPVIRRAWDGDKLSTLTKNSPLTATGAHISIVGHATTQELCEYVTRTEIANGFANRFLFAMIRRSKKLPFGGALSESEIQKMGALLKNALDEAKPLGRVTMTDAAREKWVAVYDSLSEGQDGLLGAVTARAEAQVIRLALIYALLDGQPEIDEPHLKAALAVWEYCEASAAHIFGNALGDPVADEIVRALQQAGSDGMTRTAIRDLFGRHQSGERIGAALQLLATKGRARRGDKTPTGGRPPETWFAVVR